MSAARDPGASLLPERLRLDRHPRAAADGAARAARREGRALAGPPAEVEAGYGPTVVETTSSGSVEVVTTKNGLKWLPIAVRPT